MVGLLTDRISENMHSDCRFWHRSEGFLSGQEAATEGCEQELVERAREEVRLGQLKWRKLDRKKQVRQSWVLFCLVGKIQDMLIPKAGSHRFHFDLICDSCGG